MDDRVVAAHVIKMVEELGAGCPDVHRMTVRFKAQEHMSEYQVALHLVQLIRRSESKLPPHTSITVAVGRRGMEYCAYVYTD